MNEELPEDQLIELARKAKPVPVEIEGVTKKSALKKNYSTVIEFMNSTGLKPGRNEVEKSIIYEAYSTWAKVSCSNSTFFREFNKYFKKINSSYKLNMMPITLMEIIKEIKKNEENQKKKD